MLPELPDARMETRKPIEVPPKFAGHSSWFNQPQNKFLG
jgi:hypothetical protein